MSANPGFTQVFGGGPVQPSNQLYLSLTLNATLTQLTWPLENQTGQTYLSDLMDVLPTTSGQSIALPDATQGSQGLTSFINNLGSVAFNVTDYQGNPILTAAAGTVWMIYLQSNVSQAGQWAALQFGASSASVNVAALAGAGLQVVNQSLAQAMQSTALTTSYASSVADLATNFIWNGGTGVFTAPPVGTLNDEWFIGLVNAGTGVLTFTPQSGTLIDNAATKAIAVGGTCFIFTDGTNFWSLGYGLSGAANGFGYINVALPASGAYSLSGAQLNQVSYLLTGALTGTVTLTVPAAVQQYWFNNQTTGNQTLTVVSAGGGTSINVAQGSQVILYCDGTNMISAVTGTSLPITIGQGGTGATTAAGAVTALGGSSVGAAIFTTASAAAALSTLGGGATGIAVFESASSVGVWSAIISTATPSTGLYKTGGSLVIANNGVAVFTITSSGYISTAQGISVQNTVSGSATIQTLCFGGGDGVIAYANNGSNTLASISVQDGYANNRRWSIRSGGVFPGVFDLYDFNDSRSVITGASNGQVQLFEPSFSLTALQNAATVSSGSFTATLTGVSGSVTGTAYYSRVGPFVLLNIPSLSGASNATSLTITGLPATLWPAANTYTSSVIYALSSGVSTTNVFATLGPSGTIRYAINENYTGWANDGSTKGPANGHVFPYTLI